MPDVDALVREQIEAFRPSGGPAFDELLQRRRARDRRRAVLAGGGAAVVVLAAALGWQSTTGAGAGLDRAAPAVGAPAASFGAHLVLDAAPADRATGTVAAPAPPGSAAFPAGFSCPAEPAGTPRQWPDGLVACTARGLQPEILRLGPAATDGGAIAGVRVTPTPAQGYWSVEVRLSEAGRRAHERLLAQAACAPSRTVALVVDGVVHMTEGFDASVPCNGDGIAPSSLVLTVPAPTEAAAQRFARALTTP